MDISLGFDAEGRNPKDDYYSVAISTTHWSRRVVREGAIMETSTGIRNCRHGLTRALLTSSLDSNTHAMSLTAVRNSAGDIGDTERFYVRPDLALSFNRMR